MTIIRKRFTHTLLPALLAAFAGFAACSSDDDAPEPAKPSGYDIYTAGYTTPASKAVSTVWKNGQLLYTLTDGSSYAEATAVCRFGHTLYTAGYHTDGFEEEGVVWKEGQELFDLSDGPGSGSMPYSVAVCYDDIFTAGTIFGTTRTAVVWHGDEIRYTLSDGTGHSEAYSMYVVPLYD